MPQRHCEIAERFREPIRGCVTSYNQLRGFGFINSEEAREDIMVHAFLVKRAGYKTLTPGQKVRIFYARLSDGKLRALYLFGPNNSKSRRRAKESV